MKHIRIIPLLLAFFIIVATCPMQTNAAVKTGSDGKGAGQLTKEQVGSIQNPSSSESVNDDSWKQRYIDFIETDIDITQSADRCTCGLIYLDNDEIPELIYDFGDNSCGTGIVSYKNGERDVHLFYRGGGIQYLEKEGLIYNSDNVQEGVYDELARLDEEGFHDLGRGFRYFESQKSSDHAQFYWNDEEVSEESYYANIDIFNNSRVKKWNSYSEEFKMNNYSPDEMIKFLMGNDVKNPSDSYEGIIEQYQERLTIDYSNYELEALRPKYPHLNFDLIYDAYMNECGLSYWLYDIDQNGTKELFITSDYGNEEINGYFYALYTLGDNQVIPLITDCVYRIMFYVCEDGSIIKYSSTSATTGEAIVYKMDDLGDKLVPDDAYDIDYENYPNAPYSNGKERLTKEEFDSKYRMVDSSVFENVNK